MKNFSSGEIVLISNMFVNKHKFAAQKDAKALGLIISKFKSSYSMMSKAVRNGQPQAEYYYVLYAAGGCICFTQIHEYYLSKI